MRVGTHSGDTGIPQKRDTRMRAESVLPVPPFTVDQELPIRAAADNAMPEDDAATVRPLRADQLEPALRVIEAAQHLAATGGDLDDTLAGLARQLTEFIDASACLISRID